MRKLAFVCGLVGTFAAASAFAAPIKLSYTGIVKSVNDTSGQLSSISVGSTTVSGSVIYNTDVPFTESNSYSAYSAKYVQNLNFLERNTITLNTSSGASTISYNGGLNPLLDIAPKESIQYNERGYVFQRYNYYTGKYEEGFSITNGFGTVCGNINTDCHPSALFTENLDLSGNLAPLGLSLEFFQAISNPNSAFGLINLSSYTGDIIDFTKLNISATGALGFVSEGAGLRELQYSDLQFDITSFSFEAVTSPVTSDVPEAPTIAVMGMGLLGLGLARRRKAKKLAA